MTKRPWSEKEVLLLRTSYADALTGDIAKQLGRTVKAVTHKANALGIRKSSAFISTLNRRFIENTAEPIGISTRFGKGMRPWNKGLRGPSMGGYDHRFKAGERRGRANDLYRAIGSERINKNGVIERKINDDLPMQSRWRAVHLLIWESEHGPVPDGHAVIFRDGNKGNLCIENLQLISRADLMRKNSVHRYGVEIYLLCQLQGAITRQINRRTMKDSQHE